MQQIILLGQSFFNFFTSRHSFTLSKIWFATVSTCGSQPLVVGDPQNRMKYFLETHIALKFRYWRSKVSAWDPKVGRYPRVKNTGLHNNFRHPKLQIIINLNRNHTLQIHFHVTIVIPQLGITDLRPSSHYKIIYSFSCYHHVIIKAHILEDYEVK